jgi:hypothetical protein
MSLFGHFCQLDNNNMLREKFESEEVRATRTDWCVSLVPFLNYYIIGRHCAIYIMNHESSSNGIEPELVAQ